MNKRGQVFLLAAIIIVLSLISVSIKYNTAREYPLLVDYEQISGNYLNEMPKIVNYAKFKNEDPKTLLDTFTKSYVETAHTRDPKFGVFYAYKDEGGVHFVNTLSNRVLNVRVIDSQGINHDIKLYGNVASSNSVCIAGIGCDTTSSQIVEFGGEFSNIRDLKNIDVDSLIICLDGAPGTGTCLTTLREGTLSAFTDSQAPIIIPQEIGVESRGILTNVNVDVQES